MTCLVCGGDRLGEDFFGYHHSRYIDHVAEDEVWRRHDWLGVCRACEPCWQIAWPLFGWVAVPSGSTCASCSRVHDDDDWVRVYYAPDANNPNCALPVVFCAACTWRPEHARALSELRETLRALGVDT